MCDGDFCLGPMLNAYPDSLGGTLKECISFLEQPEMKDVFSSFYILPSLFNTDLDRGFSVIDYRLNDLLAEQTDLDALRSMGIDLKLDFVLNHASVLSEQFQDILKNGEQSLYRDFFIDWNRFWAGHGTMTEEGYIRPDPELLQNMFFRKPGLPILMVKFPDDSNVPYWNTFYQEVVYSHVDAQDFMAITHGKYAPAVRLASLVNAAVEQGKWPEQTELGQLEVYRGAVVDFMERNRRYLGQMDLNIRSPLVWEFYKNTLQTLAGYGAKIVRLDAFAYAPKEPGARNFLNDPGTWELLGKVTDLAKPLGITLLPEIHASYAEGTYRTIAEKGYMVYDFFLPGLLLDALERRSGEVLVQWIREICDRKMLTVNMLGCHDGMPLLDLKGLLSEERIQSLIDTVVSRGGYVKDLHGAKNVYYQVNATYYSALGEDDKKMLLARAIQLFMPGKPQVWYLDLFAGRNDHAAVQRAGAGGHKEINRTNLTCSDIAAGMKKPIVQKQIELLRMRNRFPVFSANAKIVAEVNGTKMDIRWQSGSEEAVLQTDFGDYSFSVSIRDTSSDTEYFKYDS